MATKAQEKASPSEEELDRQKELIERAQSGETEALWDLFAQYADVLYGRVILPRLGDPDGARDVLKETFLQAIRKIDTFRWKGVSIYGWLRRIAVHKVMDRHRKNGRFNRLVERLTAETETVGPTCRLADEQLIAAEERRLNQKRVHEALDKINPRYGKALRLRLLEERSREECAELMEVSMGTFDVLFFRSVKAFKKVFGDP